MASSTAPSSVRKNAFHVQRIAITIVTPVLNEADRLAHFLDALGWADEIIVIDGGSTDGTPAVACHGGAKVLTVTGTTITGQRNAGIAAARNEWVLALDADERPSDDLVEAIEAVISRPEHEAYRIRFRNFYGCRELTRGHWSHDWHVRLFHRRFRFLDRRVHERLESVTSVGQLDGYIRHEPYRNFGHHLAKVSRYAELAAADLRARGYRVSLWHLAIKPGWRFVREYVLYGSFRDGRFGFITSATSAWSAFLKYALTAMPDLVRKNEDGDRV